MTRPRRWLGLVALVGVLAVMVVAMTAWRAGDGGLGGRRDDILDLERQSPELEAAYRYVESHADMAERIPCYCGCGVLGHQHLLDCFVIRPGVYSAHAATCKICRDEAADVERLAASGLETGAIREWIDGEYSKYGPGTNTP